MLGGTQGSNERMCVVRDGHTYKIVYGGKPGGSLGPDCTDAVVERDDGVVFRGDIEIHVRESDWRAHGHHIDRRYNGFVLHVVALAFASDTRQALKSTGGTILLLALNWKSSSKRASNVSDPANEISHQRQDTPAPVQKLLLDISAVGGRVDWQMACKCETTRELEQLLLYASGLRTDDEIVPGQIRRMPIKGNVPDWVRPWGLPANAPHGRIKAISKLVVYWSEQGGIASAVEQLLKTLVSQKICQTCSGRPGSTRTKTSQCLELRALPKSS